MARFATTTDTRRSSASLDGLRAVARLGAALAVVLAIGSATPSAHEPERMKEPGGVRAADAETIATRWGVALEGIRLTAGGYMLDFRYRVLDPVRARPLFDRAVRPRLTDEKTGAVVTVPVPPKTGALRSSNEPKAGRTYFVFFANPAQLIGRYSKVTVTVGDFSVSGLTVR